MAVRNTVTVGIAVAGVVAAAWLWRDNRRLERELSRRAAVDAARPDPWDQARPDAVAAADTSGRGIPGLPALRRWAETARERPQLDAPKKETRMERRVRRTRELADLLGRDPDESEDDYRSRLLPLMQMALERPRNTVDEARRAAEAAANVTDEQRRDLDAAFEDIYSEVIDFTNTAIADGQLTPYERNVTGMLQYAGGLGSILEGAEGRIGRILSADQMRTMYDTGFEWGEYLGLHAPWERLRPPPPRPGS